MTLDSGQVFHWQKVGGGFVGTIGDLPVYVEQGGSVLKVRCGATPQPTRETRVLPRIVSHYFALDHSLAEICASFPADPIMTAACDFCRGLRIIRQPKWECLATFICSSMKQVAHIRQISLALRKRFGEPRQIGGGVLHTFPSAQRIARAFEKQAPRTLMRVARRGSEDRKLRDAFRLRAAPRISNRRLDRAGFEAAVFSASKENRNTTAA